MFVDRRVFSAVIVALLFANIVVATFRVRPVEADYTWTQAIRINADGSVSPADAPIDTIDLVTYTLTDNIVDAAPLQGQYAIRVLRDNIVLDGAGRTLRGPAQSGWVGVSFFERKNITIRNVTIKQFSYGIYVRSCGNITVCDNNMTDNLCAVELELNSNITVSGNNMTDNDYGVWGPSGVSDNLNVTISGNNMTNNLYQGVSLWNCNFTTISGNNMTDNQQSVRLWNCNFTTISGNNMTNNLYQGVSLWWCNFTTISGNNMTDNQQSVRLWYCNFTTISGNNMTNGFSDCVALFFSSNTTISDNNIANSLGDLCVRDNYGVNNTFSKNNMKYGYCGLWLIESINDTISGNNVTDNNYGVYLHASNYTIVSGNNITNNGHGVRLNNSNFTSVSRNNVTANDYGVSFLPSSNVTVSGNRLELNDYGMDLTDSSNVTLSENSVTNSFYDGVYLNHSSNVTVSGNNMESNDYGIRVESSNYTTVSDNNMTSNRSGGFCLRDSLNVTVSDNNMTSNMFDGIYLRGGFNVTISGNSMIGNADGVFLSGSYNVTVSGNNLTNNWMDGIYLSASSNVTLSGNNIAGGFSADGMDIRSSFTVAISENNIKDNSYGIRLLDSLNVTILWNNVTENDLFGIWFTNSNYSAISANNVTYSEFGVWLQNSNNTAVSGNNVTNNWMGNRLNSSFENTVSGNNVRDNFCGIYLDRSSDNTFYHNNLLSNTYHVYIVEAGYANTWDDGYPSGGNYWSGYTGQDKKSGPAQEDQGSDGIGDTPYLIDAGNQDNYPFMHSYTPGHLVVQTNLNIAGVDYPIVVESNTAISLAVANPSALHFWTSGPPGTVGCIRITLPVEIVEMPIQIFIDGQKLEPPPWPEITTNGTHYFVYFEFVQSDHILSVEYAVADIAVTSISPSKTVVGQGFTLTVDVTIQNQGNYTETFNTTLYADSIIIASILNTTLANGDFTALTFTWDTTGFVRGNYSISAYVWPVLDETDTVDNSISGGAVVVGIPGDVDPADGYVGIDDIFALASHFGQEPTHPDWDPIFDINNDIYVGIDDVFIAALHFGEEE